VASGVTKFFCWLLPAGNTQRKNMATENQKEETADSQSENEAPAVAETSEPVEMNRKGLLGRKVGMTQIFTEDGNVVPVTVIEAGPCTVLLSRSADRDGYDAIQVGYRDNLAVWRAALYAVRL
jgi:hypothetical protein